MIEARIEIKGLDDVSRKIGVATEKIQRTLVRNVAEWLMMVIRKSFETNSAADGAPWVPLSPKTAARKRGPGMLREGGALYEQVTRGATIEGNKITAGSTLKYAAAHQFGFEGDESVKGFIRRVRSRDVWGKMLGKNNKIVRGKVAFGIGNVAKHTRHMRIPARPYLPTPEFVEAGGTEIAEKYVAGVLKEEIGE